MSNTVTFHLIENPFKPEDHQTVELDHYPGKTVRDYVGDLDGDFVYALNGKAIEEDGFEKSWLSPGDVVAMTPIPEGSDKEIFRMVAIVAVSVLSAGVGAGLIGGLAAGSWGAVAAGAAISLGGTLLVNELLPPTVPDVKGDASAPTYGFDGPKNAAQEGIPVPLVFGGAWVGGNIIQLQTELSRQPMVVEGETPPPSIEGATYLPYDALYHGDERVGDYTDYDGNRGYEVTTFYAGISPDFGGNMDNNDPLSSGYNANYGGIYIPSSIRTPGDDIAINSDQLLLMAINAGEGPIAGISDVHINDEPVGNYSTEDIQIALRYGLSDQPHVPAFKSLSRPVPANVKLTENAGEWQRITTTEPVERVRLDVTYPNGIWRLTGGNSRVRAAIYIKIRIRQVGDTGPWRKFNHYAVPNNHMEYTLSENTTESRRLSFTSDRLPLAKYDIEIMDLKARVSEDPSRDGRDGTVTEVNEIIESKLKYNNTALLAMQVRAGSRINAIPKVTFWSDGLILNCYDESQGQWVQKWSDNPAWIAYNIITNRRWGMGVDPSQVVLDDFREWASFCESANLTFYGAFTTQSNSWEILGHVYRAGHAQRHRVGSKYGVVIERPREPSMLFSQSNIVKGSFRQSWVSLDERANEIDVTFSDRESLGKQRTIKIVDPIAQQRGARPVTSKIELKGAHTEEIAIREGEYALRMNALQHTVTFDAPLSAIACELGDVVEVSHDMPQWGQSARAVGEHDDKIVIDSPVFMSTGTYYALLMYPQVAIHSGQLQSVGVDSAVIGPMSVAPRVGDRLIQGDTDVAIRSVYKVGPDWNVTLDSAASLNTSSTTTIHRINHIEQVELQPQATQGDHTTLIPASILTYPTNDLVSVAIGSSQIVTKPFTVREISGDADGMRTLTLLEYSDDVFDETANQVVIPNPIPEIEAMGRAENIAFNESIAVNDKGTNDVTVEVTWTHDSPRYREANVYVRIADRPVVRLGPAVRTVNVEGVKSGDYIKVRVVPIDNEGVESSPSLAVPYVYQVVGKPVTYYAAPTSITADALASRSITLFWEPGDAEADAPLSQYEVRYMKLSDFAPGQQVVGNATLWRKQSEKVAQIDGLTQNENYRFWIRQLDATDETRHGPWSVASFATRPGDEEFFEIIPGGLSETHISDELNARIDSIQTNADSIQGVESGLQDQIDDALSELLTVKSRIDTTVNGRTIEDLAEYMDVVDGRTFTIDANLTGRIDATDAAIASAETRIEDAEDSIIDQSSQLAVQASNIAALSSVGALVPNPYFSSWGATSAPTGWDQGEFYGAGKIIKESVDTVDGTGFAIRWKNTGSTTCNMHFPNLATGFISSISVDIALKLVSGSFTGAGARVVWNKTGGSSQQLTLGFGSFFDASRLGEWQFETLQFDAPSGVTEANCESIEFYLTPNSSVHWGQHSNKDLIIDHCVVVPTPGAIVESQANAQAISSLNSRVTNNESELSSHSSDITLLQNDLNDAESNITANAGAISSLDSRVTSAEGSISSQSSQITSLNNRVTDNESGVSANASGLNALTTRVTNAEGNISSNSSDITALQNDLGDAESEITANSLAISSLDSRVTSNEGEITSQSSSITSLENRVTKAEGDIDASNTAISGLTSRVTATENATTANSNQITSLDSQLSAQESDINANSSAISSLDTRVTTAEGQITSHSSDITSLESGLSDLQNDVSANSSALSSLDTRVSDTESGLTAQGTRIDSLETSVGNAQSDISANSSAVSALDSRVTTAEGDIESNSSSITALGSRVTTAEGNISANGSAIGSLETRVTATEGSISSHSADITQLQNDLDLAEDDIAANAGATSALTTRVTAAEGDISSNSSSITSLSGRITTAENDIDANASATSALETRMTSAEGSISSQSTDITALQNDLSTAEGNITGNSNAINSLDSRVTANEGDISSQSSSITSLTNRVSTAEGDISGNSTAISGLTSRVTAAEGDISSQSTDITNLQNSLAATNDDVTANSNSLSSLDSRVTSAEGTITSHGSQLTQLQNDLNSAESDITANSNAVSNLQSQVTANDNELSSQATQITQLQNAIDDAEADISANSSAVSSLDSRVTANESDITSQSSSITALTNRVTTAEGDIDANTSATNALTTRVTNTEGNISTINTDITNLESSVSSLQSDVTANGEATSALTLRVDANESGISSNSTDITNLQNSLTTTNNNVSANSSAVSLLDSRVTANENDITSQSSQITALSGEIDTVDGKTATNASAISGLTTRVTNAEGDITSNSQDISSLTNRVTDAENEAAANSSAISALDSRVDSTESSISSQSSQITSLENSITSLEDERLPANSNLEARWTFAGGFYDSAERLLADVSGNGHDADRFSVGKGSYTFHGSAGPAGPAIEITNQSGGGLWLLDHSFVSQHTKQTVFGWYKPHDDASRFDDQARIISRDVSDYGGVYLKDNGPTWSNGEMPVTVRFDAQGTGVNLTGRIKQGQWVMIMFAQDYDAGQGLCVMAFEDGDVDVHTGTIGAATPSSREQRGWVLGANCESASGPNNTASSVASGLYSDFRFYSTALTYANAMAMFKNPQLTDGVDPVAVSFAHNQLTSRVTQAESDIDANTSSITSIGNTVNHPTTGVSANASGLSSLTTRVTSAEGTISSHTQSINTLTADLNSAEQDISANATAHQQLVATVSSLDGQVQAEAQKISQLEVRSRGDADNLVAKSSFEDGLTGDWGPATVVSVNNASVPFSKALQWTQRDCYSTYDNSPNGEDGTNWFQVDPGEVFEIEAYLNAAQANHEVNFGISFREADDSPAWITIGNLQPGQGWQKVTGRITAPTGAIWGRAFLQNEGNSNFGSAKAAGLRIYRDNAIRSAKVQELDTVTLGPNGLTASKVVKTDANGYVAGYGLYNDGSQGSRFDINVDRFAIAHPSATNATFAVESGVVKMSGAHIKNATIGTAQIANAAITTAKIGNAQITDAKIQSLNANKINAGSIQASVMQATTVYADKLEGDVSKIVPISYDLQETVTSAKEIFRVELPAPTHSQGHVLAIQGLIRCSSNDCFGIEVKVEEIGSTTYYNHITSGGAVSALSVISTSTTPTTTVRRISFEIPGDRVRDIERDLFKQASDPVPSRFHTDSAFYKGSTDKTVISGRDVHYNSDSSYVPIANGDQLYAKITGGERSLGTFKTYYVNQEVLAFSYSQRNWVKGAAEISFVLNPLTSSSVLLHSVDGVIMGVR